MGALENKAVYLAKLSRAAIFLRGTYLEEVKNRLPEKSENRIKNARSGVIQDQEVLEVLIDIADRERLARRQKALDELVLTNQPLREYAEAS